MIQISPQAPLWARQFAESINKELNRRVPLGLKDFTTANLPSASEHRYKAVWNTTLSIVCVSDGSNWIRQDTGASV